MARLTALPSIDIIRGFKGVLDFYLWKGLPCVRKWPVRRPGRRTDAEIASAALFGKISSDFRLLAPLALQAYQIEAKDQPRTARDLYISGVYGHLHEVIPAPEPPPPPPEVEMYDAYIHLHDAKPEGTHGGTFTSGAWRTRDLNQKLADTKDLCTLAGNQITLQAGTYRALISVPACHVWRHRARLQNVTDGVTLLSGTSQIAITEHDAPNRAWISGRFTLADAKTLQIQHRCSASHTNTGLGIAGIYGEEIYTVAEFWRETPEP